MQFVSPMPFAEAVQKLGGRSPIGSQLTSQEWSQVPLALRERAFFSATVENVRFLQRSKDALGDFLTSAREEVTLADGTKTMALKTGSRAQFIAQMRELAIKEGMGPLDPKDAGGLKDIRSEQRLGLIFDVQTQAAQQYGSWKQGMDPDVLNEFPAQRFIREVDVRAPRIIHLQNEGVVRLKTDLEWWRGMNSPAIGGFGVPWGPWGFNSGMGVEDVDRDEAEALGLLTATDVVRPIEQDFNAVMQASVKSLSPDMVARLRNAFGNQIEIADGMARWKGAPPEPVAPRPAAPTALVSPSRVEEIQRQMSELVARRAGASPREIEALTEAAHKLVEVPMAQRAQVPVEPLTRRPREIKEAVAGGADAISRFVSPDLVRSMKAFKVETIPDGGRANYSPAEHSIRISRHTSKSVAAHELMHGVEILNKDVLRGAAEFLARRGSGQAPQMLRRLTGNSGYQSSEIALEDDWVRRGGSVYAGKVYSFGAKGSVDASKIWATEVLTMGIERLLAQPVEFYRDDPDWFMLLITLLRRP